MNPMTKVLTCHFSHSFFGHISHSHRRSEECHALALPTQSFIYISALMPAVFTPRSEDLILRSERKSEIEKTHRERCVLLPLKLQYLSHHPKFYRLPFAASTRSEKISRSVSAVEIALMRDFS